jgi:hypothetical protein
MAPDSDHRTAEVLMTAERFIVPRGGSRETQALITEIHAMRRKFNAAILRRDQAAGRVDALEAQRKAQRWLNAAHPPQWYRQQIACEQRELTSAQTDIELLGAAARRDDGTSQAGVHEGRGRENRSDEGIPQHAVDTARRSPAS